MNVIIKTYSIQSRNVWNVTVESHLLTYAATKECCYSILCFNRSSSPGIHTRAMWSSVLRRVFSCDEVSALQNSMVTGVAPRKLLRIALVCEYLATKDLFWYSIANARRDLHYYSRLYFHILEVIYVIKRYCSESCINILY